MTVGLILQPSPIKHALHTDCRGLIVSTCLFGYFFWSSFGERPHHILGCQRVDMNSCLSQAWALIRSSTSKDWIMSCCPHVCRSVLCCRTAGDKQSALRLQLSETGVKKLFMQPAGGWCVYTDGWDTLSHTAHCSLCIDSWTRSCREHFQTKKHHFYVECYHF